MKIDLQLFAGVNGVATPSANSPVYTQSVSTNDSAGRRDLDVSKQIARLIPDASPFTVILMRARKQIADSSYFYWYDSQPGGWWSQTRASETDSATTIRVTDASVFRPRDLVKVVSTGEVMFVTAIDESAGANTLTVERSYGTTAAASIADEAWLMRLGNAMEQFSTAPGAKIMQPTKAENLTQFGCLVA